MSQLLALVHHLTQNEFLSGTFSIQGKARNRKERDPGCTEGAGGLQTLSGRFFLRFPDYSEAVRCHGVAKKLICPA